MPFQPMAGVEIPIGGQSFRIAEHPVVPGVPYGQQGRKGTVYQVLAEGNPKALKVFAPRFRDPALVGIAERISAYVALPGVAAAGRSVLTPRREEDLLRQFPDLTYAVLMPWIEGPNWTELITEGRALTRDDSLHLAGSLLQVLVSLEQRGAAHCDLSGSNLLIPYMVPAAGAGGSLRHHGVELVDLEELCAPGLDRPTAVPTGSPGYAHQIVGTGAWCAEADRFAGAVLLAELLGWCDDRVRLAAWGESYFDPAEIHARSDRYQLLRHVLAERWGETAAALFERAWRSDLLRDCPTFGEWLVALPPAVAADAGTPQARSEPDDDQELAELFQEGLGAYHRGDRAAARELLSEVVRRDPEYNRGGVHAADLLRAANPGPEPEQPLAPASWWLRILSDAAPGPSPMPKLPPKLPQFNRDAYLMPWHLANLVRPQEGRLSAGLAPPVAALAGRLRTSLRGLREKLEYSLPTAPRDRLAPAYLELSKAVESFCQRLTLINPQSLDQQGIEDVAAQADTLRRQAEVVGRTSRKG